ncbi:MAG: lipoyl synthase [Candidatus Eisenbacteria bacterium]|uniref:Lipoyl synthase n=1 Tax=Eiseniibacteriota bacterium TaxID=2212470 RepID=A0A948RWT1_UNCEI|nr:lipoyl synthase [Candidatus Eisenbacteria bacterium]MBU1950207.1 lipoyl synthase [Candidatus Eisenbacteria bacterium]MBU2691396.1 lipoyl synthase [Candidatus Eisenbacteria bacterium]
MERKPGGESAKPQRRPPWLKIRLPETGGFANTRKIVSSRRLHTVCEEARCPNIGECWSAGTATFIILGDTCTRACRFCAVKTGRPGLPDPGEPARVAEAVREMGIHHAVITSVTRDDCDDGGAGPFALTVQAIRKINKECTVELLIPDFKGNPALQQIVFDAKPDVLAHNVETVPALYHTVRPQADYQRSLTLLERAAAAGLAAKSGLMLGLGETKDQVDEVLRDLRAHRCTLLTLGQYLQPTKSHLPVEQFITPDEFKEWDQRAKELGFRHCESGPLVRSSYHAERAINPSG